MENEAGTSSMRIYFPEHFSLIKNIDFLDHIADAEKIVFERVLYATCKNPEEADNFIRVLNKLCIANNKVVKASRLGPAFYARKANNYKKMKTALQIRKLPENFTLDVIKKNFPLASDISTLKTSAIVVFNSEEDCLLSYYQSFNKQWTPSCMPEVEYPSKDCSDALDLFQHTDPDILVCGHPHKYITNPSMVSVELKCKFELKSQVLLLDLLKTAQDVILSRACSVSFGEGTSVWERRRLLEGFNLKGGNVVVWVNNADNKKGEPNNSQNSRSCGKGLFERSLSPSQEESTEDQESKSTSVSAANIKKRKSSSLDSASNKKRKGSKFNTSQKKQSRQTKKTHRLKPVKK